MAGLGELSAMEQQRAVRIAANRARMQEVGLLAVVQTITTAHTAAAVERRAKVRASKAARRAVGTAPAGRVRRSERVAGIDVPNYNENSKLLSLADGSGEGGGRDRRLMRENVAEEIYGVEHLDALGSCNQQWDLFVDGYDAKGERVYDKVNGQTCHQCRQKTLGKRTACSGCHTLQGVLCGDCLYMRYGESVNEVNASPDWLCPLCRDLCNCSFHRSKRGWAPTGTLYRHAIAHGYKSVAHYLVLNSLSDEAKPVALERGLCPPELAEDLKKEVAEAKAAAGKPAAKEGPAATEGEASKERGAPFAELPPAAVEEQLLLPEGDELGDKQPAEVQQAAVPASVRSMCAARASSSSKQQPAQAAQQVAVPRKRKQSTIELAVGSTKQNEVAAEAPALERRGLRTSARVRS